MPSLAMLLSGDCPFRPAPLELTFDTPPAATCPHFVPANIDASRRTQSNRRDWHDARSQRSCYEARNSLHPRPTTLCNELETRVLCVSFVLHTSLRNRTTSAASHGRGSVQGFAIRCESADFVLQSPRDAILVPQVMKQLSPTIAARDHVVDRIGVFEARKSGHESAR